MTKANRVKVYEEHLKQEGYAPNVDDNGNIVFKSEGKVYIIVLEDEDEAFFRLIFPNFWSIDSKRERTKVESAALTSTERTKVAKVFTVGDNVWATVEMFVDSPDVVKPVFARCMSALRTAVANFVVEMKK